MLGLTMRSLARVGAEVVRVERGSAADAAGIEAGDVITAIGASLAPNGAQVESSFASARLGDFMIVTLMRGPAHRVVAIQR
jgi:S1-C subfamily serine protease